jgi:hypothetical protein
VDEHGPDAIPILRKRAKAADMSDDALAAETWRDIANADERILQEKDGPK